MLMLWWLLQVSAHDPGHMADTGLLLPGLTAACPQAWQQYASHKHNTCVLFLPYMDLAQ